MLHLCAGTILKDTSLSFEATDPFKIFRVPALKTTAGRIVPSAYLYIVRALAREHCLPKLLCHLYITEKCAAAHALNDRAPACLDRSFFHVLSDGSILPQHGKHVEVCAPAYHSGDTMTVQATTALSAYSLVVIVEKRPHVRLIYSDKILPRQRHRFVLMFAFCADHSIPTSFSAGVSF